LSPRTFDVAFAADGRGRSRLLEPVVVVVESALIVEVGAFAGAAAIRTVWPAAAVGEPAQTDFAPSNVPVTEHPALSVTVTVAV
jgi:hypothetical protein